MRYLATHPPTIRDVMWLAVLLAVLFLPVELSRAQFKSAPAVQIGAKLGLSSYTGDIGSVQPGEGRFDLTYEGEVFYRFGRWAGVGFRHSTGLYPHLGDGSTRRHSTALAIRSYLLDTRFSPYLQIGASRSYGGVGVGYGINGAVGVEIAVSRALAVFQDFSIDSVSPDEALDGVKGGRSFDTFGRFGAGIRVNITRSRKGLRLVELRRPVGLVAGELGTFEAVVEDAGAGAVMYEWEMPGGKVYASNPVQHRFDLAGTYEAIVTVVGPNKRVSERFTIDVGVPPVPVVEVVEPEEIVTSSPRISGVLGPDEIIVSDENDFILEYEPVDGPEATIHWDMGNGTWLQGDRIRHSYPESGVYEVRVSIETVYGFDLFPFEVVVVDSSVVERISLEEEVEEDRPNSDVGAPKILEVFGPRQLAVGEEVTYSLELESDSTSEAAINWDLGDGTWRRGYRAVHQYAGAGVYEVHVSTENEVGFDIVSFDVVVSGGDSLPETDPNESEDVDRSANETDVVDTPVESPAQPIEVLTTDSEDPSHLTLNWSIGGYTWIADSFGDAASAEAYLARFARLNYPSGIYRDTSLGGVVYHVVVGQFATEAVAEKVSPRIQLHVPRRLRLLELTPAN